MIPPAPPVVLHRRPWGDEFELADGSIWRPTPSGCHLVRLPTAHNTAACRSTLRGRHSAAAAAWAMPPARPAPALPQLVEERWSCERCGSDQFSASVGDPTVCVRCDAARQRLARAVAFVCSSCGRDTIAPAPANPAICVQCARKHAQAAD